MTYTREQVIERYRALGNIKMVCTETGCPPYVAYKWLKMAKALNAKEAVHYGTEGNKNGVKAELEFQRLVPFAMNSNTHLETNCPSYDFDIAGVTVDVKYASLNVRAGLYSIRTAQQKHFGPDYFVLFLADEGQKNLVTGQYRIIVLPAELLGDIKTVTIQKNSGRYWDFQIKADDLAAFFQDFLAVQS